MCSETTREKSEGDEFPKTIHDFSLKLEPLGFEYPEDEIPLSPIKPQLDLDPSDIWTEEFRRREGEDQPCCGLHDEGEDVCGIYDLSNPNPIYENVQTLSSCINCKRAQVQILSLQCRHAVLCENCSESALICPLCFEIIESTIRIFIGFSMRKRHSR